MRLDQALLCLLAATEAAAQHFVPTPSDMTELRSRKFESVEVSYKQTSICESTPGVKAYSGFFHLDNFEKTDKHHIFFWYFGKCPYSLLLKSHGIHSNVCIVAEARKNSATAPTTIYMPGGPATSFLDASTPFPCTINEDSNSTTLNPWSFNNEVNVLYVDMPVQGGYSYTKPQDGFYDLLTRVFNPIASGETPPANLTAYPATLSSQLPTDSLNTTTQVAHQMWQISQVFFQEFPGHKTSNDQIHLWTYSYSGLTGPGTLVYFKQQNDRIADGTIANAIPLNVIGFGTLNGCIDCLIQADSIPEFANNNTYGLRTVTPEVAELMKQNLTMPGGGKELINRCREIQMEQDPEEWGNNTEVNSVCFAATVMNFLYIQGSFASSLRNHFDINIQLPGDDVPHFASGFYNRRWVQQALGSPVNFTLNSDTVPLAFGSTGDLMIRNIKDLDALAAAGVHLTFVYGDLDHRCNWFGVEKVTLSMAYPAASNFRAAGYAEIQTNAQLVGGKVRQHDGVSFSRVYQAGHGVGHYQPETVYQIFRRSILGLDISTGQVPADRSYSTEGSATALEDVGLPTPPKQMCYVYNIEVLCNDEQKAAFQNGTAVVVDFVIVSPPSKEVPVTSPPNGGGGSSGTPKLNESAKTAGNVAYMALIMLSSIWML